MKTNKNVTGLKTSGFRDNGWEEEYKCLCKKVQLRTIMKVITIFVWIFALYSMIKFVIDIIAAKNQVTSTFSMIFCIFSAIVLFLSVFINPMNLSKRKLAKWAMVTLMISNFIYAIQYLQTSMYPSAGIVAIFIIL